MNIPPTPIHPDPPVLIRIKGSHREMGRQMGEAFAPAIHHCLENTRNLIANGYGMLGLSWDGAQTQGRKYIPFAQERYPQYVEELVGIAEGAGVPLNDLIVLTAIEGVTVDALYLTKCSSFAVNGDITTDGRVLVAHNEDWIPEDEEDICILHAKPDDEPHFLAINYGGFLPNVGFNAEGIAQCCDAVYANDSRMGIPRVIVSRAVLGARTLAGAIRHMLVPRRAAGYNHLLAHESGELYNVEVSARHFAISYARDDFILHTNHYLDPNMQAIESNSDDLVNSRVRYFRLLRLLSQEPRHTVKSLQEIQRDHVNYPNSICNHIDEIDSLIERQKTVTALIMDLTNRVMHVCWGNPCTNAYHSYYLDA